MKASGGVYDYIIIGSGFGGSVSAMRLTQKGYRVLVLEKGKRFRDEDFAKSNWQVWKYLWAPVARCFGILQISLLNGVMVLHGSGVGGGSLGYANVLMEPDDKLFEAPAWKHLADWKNVLRPHYTMAKRMLGVTRNPRLWPADGTLEEIASELGQRQTFTATDVGIYFSENGAGGETSDPYFEGDGPPRQGCIHCGGCMVGCRHNAKNTLVKNYLYFAEKWGAEIRSETAVENVIPLQGAQEDGARYQLEFQSSTGWLKRRGSKSVRAKNIIFSAGVMGTLGLLFHCRDKTKTLPKLSQRLGDQVRTNSEALLGVINRSGKKDYSEGIAITSLFHADEVTAIEPVRYPDGSSLMRFMGAPLIDEGAQLWVRWLKSAWSVLTHPIDFFHSHLRPGWAGRTTIMLVMQTKDNLIRIRFKRNLFTLLRRGLVTEQDEKHPYIPTKIELGHYVTKSFAEKTNGIPAGTVVEGLLNIPTTAHILGGVPFGETAEDGVIGLDCQIHNYPGLFVIDGSIMPANPGINPSLTITALAEYAMSHVKPQIPADIKKSGATLTVAP